MSVVEPGSGRKFFSAADKGERNGAFNVPNEGADLSPAALPNAETVAMAREKVAKKA